MSLEADIKNVDIEHRAVQDVFERPQRSCPELRFQ